MIRWYVKGRTQHGNTVILSEHYTEEDALEEEVWADINNPDMHVFVEAVGMYNEEDML